MSTDVCSTVANAERHRLRDCWK